MASELRIYRGLPGSGKTTLAEQEIAAHGGRLAGRDHIRRLLGSDHRWNYSNSLEKEVSDLQERIIISGLSLGQTVHVDDMNLRARYVKRLLGIAEEMGAEVQIIDLTNVSLEECIERDAARLRTVGVQFILDQHTKYIKGQPWPLPVPELTTLPERRVPRPYTPVAGTTPAFLIDLDGTVARHEGVRGHHDYDRVSEDLPNQPVIFAVRAVLTSGLYPIFVSGRPDSCREDTSIWIQKNVMVGPYHLHMRKTGDHRPDFLVKMEIFDQQIRENFNVRMAFDDRNQVVRMYREMGLTVLQVAEGNF